MSDGCHHVYALKPKTSANAEDVYAIEAIICCSLYPLVGPTGEEEYFYLVRWQGYGPEHDTWEPRSNLTNSSEAVKEYDVRSECQSTRPHSLFMPRRF